VPPLLKLTFSGSAEFGYNDTDLDGAGDDDTDGFYWSSDITLALSQTLDNGLTASVGVGIDLSDGDLGSPLSASDFVLSLTSENSGLYFGATDTAAGKHYTSAVSGMDSDAFTSDTDNPVVRGDITYGGVSASVSLIVDADNTSNTGQLSVGASGSFGNFTFGVGYQEEAAGFDDNGDFEGNGVFAVEVGTTFGGASVTLAYAQDQTADTDSIGVAASYPIGPVTVGAYYAMQDAGDNYGISVDYANGPITVGVYYDVEAGADDDWGIEGSYAVGNGHHRLCRRRRCGRRLLRCRQHRPRRKLVAADLLCRRRRR
jgi:outer membrane protein OmpU